MKLSQIARYWAARELTRIERPEPGRIAFQAPFACPEFTIKLALTADFGSQRTSRVRVAAEGKETPLSPVAELRLLGPGTFYRDDRALVACFDLTRGASGLLLE